MNGRLRCQPDNGNSLDDVSEKDYRKAKHSVLRSCRIQYQLTDTLLIVAGDCGFGFEKPEYYENVFKRNSARLSKANNWIVMVRGNCDE